MVSTTRPSIGGNLGIEAICVQAATVFIGVCFSKSITLGNGSWLNIQQILCLLKTRYQLRSALQRFVTALRRVLHVQLAKYPLF